MFWTQISYITFRLLYIKYSLSSCIRWIARLNYHYLIRYLHIIRFREYTQFTLSTPLFSTFILYLFICRSISKCGLHALIHVLRSLSFHRALYGLACTLWLKFRYTFSQSVLAQPKSLQSSLSYHPNQPHPGYGLLAYSSDPARYFNVIAIHYIAPKSGWCDDAKSRFYNRPIERPFVPSHEALWRRDGLYDVFFELGYNDVTPEPGQGSAIFLHLQKNNFNPTLGCVAVSWRSMEFILQHADPGCQLSVHQGA